MGVALAGVFGVEKKLNRDPTPALGVFAGGVVIVLVDSSDDTGDRFLDCLEGNSVNVVGRWRISIEDMAEEIEEESWSANGTPTVTGAEEPVNHDAILPFVSSTCVAPSMERAGRNSLKPLSWPELYFLSGLCELGRFADVNGKIAV